MSEIEVEGGGIDGLLAAIGVRLAGARAAQADDSDSGGGGLRLAVGDDDGDDGPGLEVGR